MRFVLAVTLLAVVGCQSRSGAALDTTGTGTPQDTSPRTGFTAIRPLTDADRRLGDSLATAHESQPSGQSPESWQLLSISYFGARAQVSVWSTDGHAVQDTTAPEDRSCEGFDESHPDSPDTGIGCLEHDRSADFRWIPPGEALVQFSPMDTGTIHFQVEAISRAGDHNREWPGLTFRVRPGRVQRFRIQLPVAATPDPMLVESITGSVDTVPPRVDPDSARG